LVLRIEENRMRSYVLASLIASCLAAACGGEAPSADPASNAVMTAPGSDVAAIDAKSENPAGSIGGKYPTAPTKQKHWACNN
jgi:hypothetical protein